MLKCKEVAGRASDYIDRQLGWKDNFLMYTHLIMCAHCRRFVKHLATTIGVAQRAGRRLASPDEVDTTLANLQGKKGSE